MSSVSSSFQAKISTIASTLANGQKNLLINERLEVVQKWGVKWRLLSLLDYVYSFFGLDVYAPLRADQVAKQLFLLCEENKRALNKTIVDQVSEKIIKCLNQKTKGKYKAALFATIDKIQALLPPPPPPSRLKWPSAEGLVELGVTPQQKEVLDKALNECLTQMEKIGKTSFQIIKFPDPSKTRVIKLFDEADLLIGGYVIPSTVSIKSLNGRLVVLLMGKKVIAEGGERKVKVAFDLTNGTPYVKKRISNIMEEKIYQWIQELPNSRGLPRNTITRTIGKKSQILEPRYTESLEQCLGSEGLKSWDVKKSLILDLLYGLKHFHSITTCCSLQINGETFSCESVPNYHGDIKARNALLRNTNALPEAVWTDFGISSEVFSLNGTPGCQAPERVEIKAKWALDNTVVSLIDIGNHNYKFGQQGDVWGMALVMLVIIANDPSRPFPLICIENAIKKSEDCVVKDFYVKNLTQQVIDDELSFYNFKILTDPAFFAADSLLRVVGKMLRANPKERISIEEAINMVEAVKLT